MNKKPQTTAPRFWFSTEALVGLLLVIINSLVVIGWLTNTTVLIHPFGGPAVTVGSILSSCVVAVLLILHAAIPNEKTFHRYATIGLLLLLFGVLLKSAALQFSLPLMVHVNMYELIGCALSVLAIALLSSPFRHSARSSRLLGGCIILCGLIGIAGYVYNIPHVGDFLTFFGAILLVINGVGILALSVYAFQVYKLRLILFGTALLAVMVLVISAISQKMIDDYRAATNNVEHTYKILNRIGELESDLVNSETGQRGYIITQDTKFLEPYNAAVNDVNRAVDDIFVLTKDNPRQQAYKQKLTELITQRLTFIKRSIDVVGQGQTAQVIEGVKSGTGKRLMDEIRVILKAMETEERGLLTTRTAALERSSQSVGFIRIVSTSTGILLLFVIVASVLRSIRKLEEGRKLLKAANDELTVANAKSEALLSSIGDGVFALDMNGNIILFNPSAEQITGLTAESVLGQHYTNMLRFRDAKTNAPRDAFIRTALGGRISSIPNHVVLDLPEGRRMPVADSAAPIFNSEGQQMGIIVVFRDISKEVELERSKDDFVSLTSHQLRTPLSAIGWYGEMLLNGDVGTLTPEQREIVTEIYEGNARMVDLVNSLLNVSRLDLGKLENKPEVVSVKALLKSLKQELSESIHTKSITFTVNIDDTLEQLFADPKLLRMIMQNLLSNALKYTPANGTVAFTLEKDSHSQRHTLLKVQDSGYGIPKAQQRNIFSKLFRAENVQRLGIEGTGLGLYIVKKAAERMGGKVWFESIEQQGTTFYVTLPSKKITKKPTRRND